MLNRFQHNFSELSMKFSSILEVRQIILKLELAFNGLKIY